MMIRLGMGVLAARMAQKVLRWLGKGATAMPGRIARRVCPNVLSLLAQRQDIILITGTNGKTTTTLIIADIFRALDYEVLTNASGANLAVGLITSLIEGKKSLKKAQKQNRPTICVLEIDEGAFAAESKNIRAKVVVATNLFRDQLDRFGALTFTRDLLARGIKDTLGTVVLNADDPLVAQLSEYCPKDVRYFGVTLEKDKDNTVTNDDATGPLADSAECPKCQEILDYAQKNFGHFGAYQCRSCGYHRPEAEYRIVCRESVTEPTTLKRMTPESVSYPVTVKHGTEIYASQTTIPGLHNLYNLTAAIAASGCFTEQKGKELSLESLCKAAQTAKPAFGRMEKIPIADKSICFTLLKNPMSMERALATMTQAEDIGAVYMLLNSHEADGRDISWLWDVDFETQRYPAHVYVSGERSGDLYLRLIYAGVPEENVTHASLRECADTVEKALADCQPGQCLYVLHNYSPMLQLRDALSDKYPLKDFWR